MCRLDERQRALVEDNLKLVHFVLKKMGVSREDTDYDDFFSTGCVGLCNAARVFRKNGSAFSTFAFHVIKHEILKALMQRSLDRHNLTSFDELGGGITVPEYGFEKTEASLLLEEFCRYADRNLGDTAAVLRLSAAEKSCGQAAAALKISVRAAYRAKKRAGAAFAVWLRKGE